MQPIQPTDNFSWRRVWMLFRLYLPSLQKHLWAFPLVSFLLSAVYVIAMVVNPGITPSLSTITFGITIMYYFAPIALARRDYRLISDQLPVKTSEKMTLLAIYFIFVTFALTFGVEMIVCALSGVIFPQFSCKMTEIYAMAATIIPTNSMMFVSYVNAAAFPSLTLVGIMLAKRSRMWIGILCGLGAYIAVVIVGGLLAGIMTVVKLHEKSLDPSFIKADNTMAFMGDVVGVVLWVVTGLCLALLAASWIIIYKKVKRGGF